MTIVNVLMSVAIIGGFGMSLYYFTKTLTDYILKKKMIEKGYVNEDTQAIFRQQQNDGRYSSVKWGLLTLFGGLGLILLEFLHVGSDSPLPYGILAVSLSLGFLLYYILVRREVIR